LKTGKGHHHESGDHDHFFKGLVMGAVVGAGLLYFLGTEEGQKMKKKLVVEGEDLVKKAKGGAGELLQDEDDLIETLPPVITAKSSPAAKTAPKTASKRYFTRRNK
jgi:hypothetical protein